MATDFFDSATEASVVKSEIVSKYFVAWCRIMKGVPTADKLAYIDLFAGTGHYDDGTPSTPIKVLKYILSDDDLKERFVTLFNDMDKSNCRKLKLNIEQIQNIGELKYPPQVSCEEVGPELVSTIMKTRLIPNLAFVDPFGYKGLSIDLIKGLTKDWGSDCIFFFNYNRISIGVTNIKIEEHINSIFGKERADALRQEISNYKKEEKADFIINALSEALVESGCTFVLPFQFNNDKRISHYLIFVSKHYLGYKIMKEIMWRASTDFDEGVGSFSYIPAENQQLTFLFNYSRSLDFLKEDIAKKFSGRTLSMKEICERHNVGTPFIATNYKEALRNLEAAGKITTYPPAQNRRKVKGEVTFADTVMVTFP